jgi:pilus assembly protein CpaB
MNWKAWTPALAAVLMGGAAAKLAHDSMARSRNAPSSTAKLVQAVAVKAAIDPGQELTLDELTFSPIDSKTPPPNAFTDPHDLVGRVSAIPMVPGQLVLSEFLAPKGASSGLQGLVPAGERAVTIDVTDTSSFSGMLAPGCRVDVVGMITDSDANKTMIRTIVQNVLVQAVGQRLAPARHEIDDKDHKPAADSLTYRSVTLIASPKDAVTIQLAALQGRVTLLLRGTGDTSDGEASTTLADLRGDPDVEASLPVAPATRPAATQPVATPDPVKVVQADPAPTHSHWVVIYNGDKVTRARFDEPSDPAAQSIKPGTANIQDPGDPNEDSLGE